MKNELREYLKEQKEIFPTKDVGQKQKCKTCLFHNREKICQIHGIKTHVDDVCTSYSFPARKKVYLAGRKS